MPTITFDDPAALAALPNAALGTFANNYTEDDVTVTDGVNPPDPRLGGGAYGHYHLMYERPGILEQVVLGARIDPAAEPRTLSNHFGDHVIQLTYDPNQDGVPDPFDITGIDVLRGTLNVGVLFASGDIGVFNNLAADGGTHWDLIGGTNITRATLEGTGSIFSIDNITFEAATAPSPPLPQVGHGRHDHGRHDGRDGGTVPETPDTTHVLIATARPPEELPEGLLAPELHEFLTALEEEILGTFGVDPPGIAPHVHDHSLVA